MAQTRLRSELLDEMPPSDVEAEACLLGSLLIRPEMFQAVDEIVVSPNTFYGHANRLIYAHMRTLFLECGAFDVLLLRSKLKKVGLLSSVGGDAYLAELVRAVPTATNAVQYAKLVREKGLLRWLTYVATRMLKDSHEVSGDPLAVATSAAVEIEKIVNHAKRLGGSQA